MIVITFEKFFLLILLFAYFLTFAIATLKRLITSLIMKWYSKIYRVIVISVTCFCIAINFASFIIFRNFAYSYIVFYISYLSLVLIIGLFPVKGH